MSTYYHDGKPLMGNDDEPHPLDANGVCCAHRLVCEAPGCDLHSESCPVRLTREQTR